MKRIVGFILLLLCFMYPLPIFATISSTTAALSDHTIAKSSTLQMTITVTNTDAQTIRYIKILRPSDAISISGVSTGWTASWDSDYVILTGRTLASGASTEVTIDITSGSVDQSSMPWSVQVSDSAAGDALFSATGDLSFTVSGNPPDTTAPIIANISLSTTNTSFTVNWDTDEAATGVLSYGTTNAYGSTKESTSLTRSHSLTATGLVADTIYYFQVDSVDGSGNTANSYNSFLVTSTTQPTATPTITPTPTSGPGATPSPTPAPDVTEPLVVLSQLPQASYGTIPTLRVHISDEHGVTSVYYSINNGVFTRIAGVGTNSSKPLDISFTPKHSVKTGTYQVKIKAIDPSGNIGLSDVQKYSIDSTGPTILFSTSFAPIMKSVPIIRGTVLDSSGIASIEYSIDNGKTWGNLPSLVTEYGVEFSSELSDPLREGRYAFIIRATDSVGNSSLSSTKSFTIDRLPPRSAGVSVTAGTIPLIPSLPSLIRATRNDTYTIFIATTGGVTNAQVVVTDSLGQKQQFNMQRSVRHDMWESTFTPMSSSLFSVAIEMDDGINKKVTEDLFQFDIRDPACITGNIILGSTVQVYALDKFQQSYLSWNASAFDQVNPLTTNEACYSFILPKGTYRLQADSPGFVSADTSPFEVMHTSVISIPIALEKARCLQIWKLKICNPFHAQISVKTSDIDDTSENVELSGQVASKVAFTGQLGELTAGKDVELVFINTWMPDSSAYLEDLEQRSKANPQLPVIVVIPFENDLFVKAWKQESGFSFPIVADMDGVASVQVGYHLGPLSVIISSGKQIKSKKIIQNVGNEVQL